MFSNIFSKRRAGRTSRRGHGKFATRPRLLALEPLEDRCLLSASLPWHNPLVPQDINNDGRVSVTDALTIIADLHANGARQLSAPAAFGEGFEMMQAAAPRTVSPQAYLDVSGDNVLTPRDAMAVIAQLQAQAQPVVMEVEVEVTDLAGNVVTGPLAVGDQFLVNVYVEDARQMPADGVDNRGIFQAFVDVTYNASLADVDGAVVAGDHFANGAQALLSRGEIGEVGGWDSPWTSSGAGRFLLMQSTFVATAAGSLTIGTNKADDAPSTVYTFDPWDMPVSTSFIDYGSTTIEIVAPTPDVQLAPGIDAIFTLEARPVGGSVGDSIYEGDDFIVAVYVEDDRGLATDLSGFVTAYLDVTFNSTLVDVVSIAHTGTAEFKYFEYTSGTIAPGLIDEVGGIQKDWGANPNGLNPPLGDSPVLVFEALCHAKSQGTAQFGTDKADNIDNVVSYLKPSLGETTAIQFNTLDVTILGSPVVAADDTASVPRDSVDFQIHVLGNDKLEGTEPYTITIISGPSHGSVAVIDVPAPNSENSRIDYTPTAGYVGADEIVYEVSDSAGNTSQATLSITVTAPNVAPDARDDGLPDTTGFTTNQYTAFKTSTVLANDVDTDPLTVVGFDTTGTKGLVTNNGDGTFNYDPNGQFAALAVGATATDTFTYTVSDGTTTDTATVTITIVGVAAAPEKVSGAVYFDTNNNGQRDAAEKALGGVTIRLQGQDVFGTPVDSEVVTDALGQYTFDDVLAGDYVLSQYQPSFLIDGIDTVNGINGGWNDSFTLTHDMALSSMQFSFAERGLQSPYIPLSDIFSTAPTHGILAGFSPTGKLRWYSLMNGWEGVTRVEAEILGAGTSVKISVYKGATGYEFAVPLSTCSAQTMLKGATAEGQVWQLIGSLADFAAHATTVVDAAFAEL